MGIPFGQKIFIGNFFRLKFTPIIGTENLLIEEIQPIPYIHIPVLKSEHPIHQSLIFRMPAFLPAGQISLPASMIIAGISPIDKKSAFVVKSQIYTLIVKSLIFKKIILPIDSSCTRAPTLQVFSSEYPSPFLVMILITPAKASVP